MPKNDRWISPRVCRILMLLLGINAGTVIGDLLLGPLGGMFGAFAGFTIVIGISHRRMHLALTQRFSHPWRRLMRPLRVLTIILVCALPLVATSNSMARPKKRGYASCCKMKRCCYENKQCCKKGNHACCTGKHTGGQGCCCKKDSCPMPESTGMTTTKSVHPAGHH